MLSPFALRLRTALSEAKGLRVNSAKDRGGSLRLLVLGMIAT